ncbi:putative hydroxymethylpyrimidine transporter CytX [Kingella negevensis]|uniref:Cytosine permease n=1 Tax=Kingella negevensis TaxID=1522312 RepID=A0A238T9U8_9NEIS|nr:putative hydroxymethylpyrimidine transporter CytX [Kingella negevensis]MDK4684879.1 putative hydroxymethylpyrimidine transporter CytX [Kingella negevensis]MDK4698208.1 putative hydroxymethylpyrimidine transporter CytX [Kingella negevensis]MDK4707761.1 putative hydroxymethylpyrimidine transporter CytX [Kingella negevensis]MDK4709284.1 putative hydroxymethylpyrimidine transporter CytX [Kingella negevensis]SNB65511.1 cytosine permease [Kingella negevensis]
MKPFSYAVLWAGAAVSLAEILTGTFFAPLGWQQGLLAIVLGHLIGGVLFFLAGYIGAVRQQTAMETVKSSFGQIGGRLFALLNVLQLVGWTAIMIYDGAAAAQVFGVMNHVLWCALIGGLIVLWLWLGNRYLSKINLLAVLALLLVTLVISTKIFSGSLKMPTGEAMSFGAAIELAAVMPLSWLPLVSDYTRSASKPFQAALISSVAYGVMSSWMYAMGLGMALFVGETDLAKILLNLGLGAIGVLMIVFSTVTTTFLDAHSASISTQAIWQRLPEKSFAMAITVLCTIAAMLFSMNDITDFLYWIGSVFAPMIAILIADFFILKKPVCEQNVNGRNVLIWLLGFGLYRYWLAHRLSVGNTLPVMAMTIVLCVITDFVLSRKFQAA